MPIYEYKCSKCDHVFEEFQPIGADGSELNCPVCNAVKPKKMFSSFASTGDDSRSNVSCASSGST